MTDTSPIQRFIGVMSGTSLDGLDVVLIRLRDGRLEVERGHTFAYPPELRHRLLALCLPTEDEINRMLAVDIELGRFIARRVLEFLQQAGLETGDIQAIGSHGQTIRHQPQGEFPNTLQIGDPNSIAQLTGITTVADFRRRDMAAGGQGAPLVPAFHQALFRVPDEDRVVVNIGGIGNITILPAETERPVVGFDTGPGNVLMDAWHQQHRGGECDRGGAWASEGRVDEALLNALLDEAFFAAPPPKSTGRELFNPDWLGAKLEGHELSPRDVQATLCAFTATSLMSAIGQYAPETRRVLVCGGGVHNSELMRRLRELAPEGVTVESSAEHGMDPDCVEGACFAWLAHQTLNGLSANLPSVTGASEAVVLGAIYPGA